MSMGYKVQNQSFSWLHLFKKGWMELMVGTMEKRLIILPEMVTMAVDLDTPDKNTGGVHVICTTYYCIANKDVSDTR